MERRVFILVKGTRGVWMRRKNKIILAIGIAMIVIGAML